MYLSSITRGSENAFVKELVPNVAFWLGASDIETEGQFLWASGEEFSFTNWRVGDPDDGIGGEDCVVIEAQVDGLWHDQQCGLSYPYLCERD